MAGVGTPLGGYANRRTDLVNYRHIDQDASLYVISGGTGLVKVGYAADVEHRITRLRTASAHEIRLVASRPVPARLKLIAESAAHHFLAEWRHHGEWFTAEPQQAVDAVDAAVALASEIYVPGGAVRDARFRLGWSQAHLAAVAGVPKERLCRAERTDGPITGNFLYSQAIRRVLAEAGEALPTFPP